MPDFPALGFKTLGFKTPGGGITRISGWWMMMGLVSLLISCQPTRKTIAPTARVLGDSESLPLIESRVNRQVPRFVSRASRTKISFFIDPGVAEPADIRNYSVWSRSHGSSASWTWLAGSEAESDGDSPAAEPTKTASEEAASTGTASAEEVSIENGQPTATIEAADGVHELRMGWILTDGRVFEPLDADAAQAILYVDTSAPVIVWDTPQSVPVVSQSLDAESGGMQKVAASDAIDPESANVATDEGGNENIAAGDGNTAPDDGDIAPGDDAIAPGDDAIAPGDDAPFAGLDEATPRRDGESLVEIQNSRLELGWTLSDTQLSGSPQQIEWHAGDGDWKLIGELDAEVGSHRFVWNLPEDVPEKLTVRVRVRDAAGNWGSAEMPLRLAGPLEFAAAQKAAAGDEFVATEPDSDSESESESELEEAALATAAGAAATTAVAGVSTPNVEGSSAITWKPLESRCLRAGETVTLGWENASVEIDLKSQVILETLVDGEWRFVAEAPLAAGSIDWVAPKETSGPQSLRFVVVAPTDENGATPGVENADDHGAEKDDAQPAVERVVSAPGTFIVDHEPPRVTLGEVPEILGGEPRLILVLPEGASECDQVSSIKVYLKPANQSFWNELGADRIQLEGTTLGLDLRLLPQGSYEIFLAATDALGQSGPEPGPDSKSLGSFVLDRNPPRLAAEALVLDWVSGFEGEAAISFEASDCVPPLVIEGREPGEEFRELSRLESLHLARGKITFAVPSDIDRYELRVTVRDRAGNLSRVSLGPRDVQPAIRLDGLGRAGEGLSIVEGTPRRLSWTLHPIALEYADELQVALELQRQPAGPWESISEGLSHDKFFDWDVPSASGQEHRLRALLYRHTNRVASDTSAPIRIFALGGDQDFNVKIAANSIAASEEAGLAYTRLIESSASVTPAVRSVFENEIESKYLEAIELDKKNYYATYGLAQLQRYRMQQGGEQAEIDDVIRHLEATVRIVPKYAMALNDLGAAYMRKREYVKAEQALKRSVESKETGKALYNLGLAQLYQGRADVARSQLNKALEYSSEDGLNIGHIRYYLVYTYLSEGKTDEARRVFQESKDEIPEELRQDIQARLE